MNDKKNLLDKIESMWSPSAEYVRCTIQFLNNHNIQQVVIRLTDEEIEEYDDGIFYYCRSRYDLESLCEEGVEDFVIIDIDNIY